jgi:hypothetical protein
MEEHSVSQNRNSTVTYEGGCRNGVYLKLKLDSMRRGFQGVFFLLEKTEWNSIGPVRF